MEVWLFILIPIILISIVISYKKWRNHIVWWEVLLLLCSILAIIGLMKGCITSSKTNDVETCMEHVLEVKHETYWNEYIKKTCTKDVQTGVNSKGEAIYTTEEYDCSYVEEYYPYTKVICKTREYIIDEGYTPNGGSEPTKFIYFSKKFNDSPQFISTHKDDIYDFYDNAKTSDIDKKFIGNSFIVKWRGELDRVEDVSWNHVYENRISVSNSIYTYQKLDTSELRINKLFDYPELHDRYIKSSILGYSNDSFDLDLYSRQRNALIASDKQVKIYYLVFKGGSRRRGLLQEQYWEGGNKNEVVICIGIDDYDNIKWSHVFSWSKKSDFKLHIANYILECKKLNISSFKNIIDYSIDNIKMDFVRREFKEFDYLTIELTISEKLWVGFIVFIFSIGIIIWIKNNEFDNN